jgi:hypothetical protein
MRLHSCEYRGSREKASTAMVLIAAALLFSATALGVGPAHSAAQESAADVGYVEDVSGRVVAFSQGKPTLLDALDVISDRTRLDLQANSELRICHYPTQKLLTLKGPLRASISRDGVTLENSKAVVASTGSCVAPVVSTFQGGIVSRGTGAKTTNVSLQPNIKVVNRGEQGIRRIALWDGDAQKLLVTFDRDAARPVLGEGQSYLLVVERNDGSEFKMMLKASAVTQAEPLIVLLR